MARSKIAKDGKARASQMIAALCKADQKFYWQDAVKPLGIVLKGESIKHFRSLLKTGLQRFAPGYTFNTHNDYTDELTANVKEIAAVVVRCAETAASGSDVVDDLPANLLD